MDQIQGNFNVQVSQDDQVIWSHGRKDGQRYGTSNRSFQEDGRILQIVAALELALMQARCEAGLDIDDSDGVLDHPAGPCQVHD